MTSQYSLMQKRYSCPEVARPSPDSDMSVALSLKRTRIRPEIARSHSDASSVISLDELDDQLCGLECGSFPRRPMLASSDRASSFSDVAEMLQPANTRRREREPLPRLFRHASEWHRRVPQYPRTESSHSEGDNRDAVSPRVDYTSRNIPEDQRGYHNALQKHCDKANFEFNMEKLRPQIEAFNRLRLTSVDYNNLNAGV